jgi:23S rRNA (guanosine2251-2'-O)-methyltransferase
VSRRRPRTVADIGAVVEGRHAVLAALEAGRVRELVVEQSRLGDDELAVAADRVREAGGTVEIVGDVRELATTTAPQGVMARCEPIAPRSLEELVAVSSPPAVLVLDHLEDARNVGAIVRSAVAAGVRALVVATDRAAPLGPAAFKAAAGTFEQVHVAVESSIAQAVVRLSKRGLWVVALDAGGDRSLFGLDLLAEPVAMVIGSEGSGVSRLVKDRADVVVSIPIAGGVESLNASTAATLAVFELARQRV